MPHAPTQPTEVLWEESPSLRMAVPLERDGRDFVKELEEQD
jgi:hypothetical protein